MMGCQFTLQRMGWLLHAGRMWEFVHGIAAVSIGDMTPNPAPADIANKGAAPC